MQKSFVAAVMILAIVAGMAGLRFSPVYRAHLNDNPDAPALQRLMIGNQRFLRGQSVHGDVTRAQLAELAKAQHPFAAVVTCSDSRVSPELLFDSGMGDLFVIRTAGNVIGDLELGSIEYAVEHLGVELLLVLGHENCGAITAYAGHGIHPDGSHIPSIISYVENEAEEQLVSRKVSDFIGESIKANIMHGVHLAQTPGSILGTAVHENKLIVAGALYRLSDGSIQLLSSELYDVGANGTPKASKTHASEKGLSTAHMP